MPKGLEKICFSLPHFINSKLPVIRSKHAYLIQSNEYYNPFSLRDKKFLS